MPQRKAPRFPIDEPVSATWTNGGAHTSVGQTRDVSTAGVFFYADFKPMEGSSIELVLTFPPELTNSESSMSVLCKGKVVRVEPDAMEGKTGVSVQIESYEVLGES